MFHTFTTFFHSNFFKSLFFICVSSLTSLVVMTIIFPDLFIYHKISFNRFGDTVQNFHGTFMLLSNVYHGGVALWNPYDQMPFAYLYAVGVMTAFSNLVTAFVYFILSFLMRFPAEGFYAFYSFFYHLPTIFISCSGLYLLYQRFTENKVILFVSLVITTSLLLPYAYLGLNPESLYSFFPLLAHFILRFFERRSFRYVLLTILTFSVCIAMYPAVALGYFYLGVHFFIISCLIWFVCVNRVKIRQNLKKIHFTHYVSFKRQKVFQFLFVIVLSAFVFGPQVYLLKTSYRDIDLSHEKSRFNNLNFIDFSSYFSAECQRNAALDEFGWRTVNYEQNAWADSWLFLGFTVIFLTIFGLLFGKDNRKYIFASTIFMFLAINTPRSMTGWQAPMHWLVALTDPFRVILCTFHMTGAFLLPYVLGVFIPIGLQSLLDIAKEKVTPFDLIRILIGSIILFFYLKSVMPFVSGTVQTYLGISFLCALAVILIILVKIIPYKKRILMAGIIVGILFIHDGYKMQVYLRDFTHQIEVIPFTQKNDKEPVLIDYQNPKILPYRYNYSSDKIADLPSPRQVDPFYMQGYFYRYTDLHKYFTAATDIQPRHTSYSRLSTDLLMKKYIQADTRLIFQADLAVPAQNEIFAQILEKGVSRQIIMVDKPFLDSNLYSDSLPSDIILTPQKSQDQNGQSKTFSSSFQNASAWKKNDMQIYLFSLPSDFPSYLATSVFTADRDFFKVTTGEKTLTPVQGKFLIPYTFDIQNIAIGKLAVSMPGSFHPVGESVILTYPFSNSGIKRLIKNETDTLGFEYEAVKDGWLVFHYPYDAKWKITLDGKQTMIYRANYSFITIPVKKGDHTILLEYWPDTPLRLFLGISMILIFFLPFALIGIELKNLNDSPYE